MVDNWIPLMYGLMAGLTVLIGAFSASAARSRLNNVRLGVLQGVAGGILAYLALETGHDAEEYVEGLARPQTLHLFLLAAAVTTAAFLTTFIVLAAVEQLNRRRGEFGLFTGLVVAIALGVHNIGEGFAIASSLLAGAVTSALTYTIGFAVHNATEGFAVAGPLLTGRASVGPARLSALAALAGLPTLAGVAVYYTGFSNGLFLALLNAIANASIVYAMVHVNIDALSKLGGVASIKFWLSLTAGVVVAFATESVLLLA